MASVAGSGLEVNGVVQEALPNGLFRVHLESDARGTAVAHVGGGSSLLRLLPGDAVVLELLPYDMTRGRIVRKRT
ncbi:MAG TPA: translation initiation factor IF-1 [Vicinamibacteria bacterium]|jgi:translation initiation factor IF-1